MVQFACGGVDPGCPATFERSSDDEILTAVAVHARNDHGMADVPPEVVEQVRAKIVAHA